MRYRVGTPPFFCEQLIRTFLSSGRGLKWRNNFLAAQYTSYVLDFASSGPMPRFELLMPGADAGAGGSTGVTGSGVSATGSAGRLGWAALAVV